MPLPEKGSRSCHSGRANASPWSRANDRHDREPGGNEAGKSDASVTIMRAFARPRVCTRWTDNLDVERLQHTAAVHVVAVSRMNGNFGGGEEKSDDEEH